MNKARRATLNKIASTIAEAKDGLGMLRDEEQEYMDNMPESLACGEKYSIAENAVSNMDDAINSLEEAVSSVEESTQ